MMMQCHGKLSVLLALCAGNQPVTSGFPVQRAGNMGFAVVFDVRLNQLLNKPMSSRLSDIP